MFDLANSNNPLNIPITPSGVNVNISNPLNTSPASSNVLSNSLLVPRHIAAQVNDEREIYAVPMGVNSSDWVLHSTKPLIYFVATDQYGNKTSILPFDIAQHVSEPEPTMQDVKNIESHLDDRISSLKDELSQLITTKIEEALK